jgi:hypothetical protein
VPGGAVVVGAVVVGAEVGENVVGAEVGENVVGAEVGENVVGAEVGENVVGGEVGAEVIMIGMMIFSKLFLLQKNGECWCYGYTGIGPVPLKFNNTLICA